MAKKTAKKGVKKAASKPATKPAPKSTKKTAAKKIVSAGPKPISTGRGAKPSELGRQLVEMYNSRTHDDKIWQALFATNWDSIEGEGTNLAFEGRKAVMNKNEQWSSANAVVSQKAEGPFCGATGFAVRFTIEIEDRATGKRQTMDEIGFYNVKDGRIVREEFCYDYRAR